MPSINLETCTLHGLLSYGKAFLNRNVVTVSLYYGMIIFVQPDAASTLG